jgi:S1-C subfamily serine protease
MRTRIFFVGFLVFTLCELALLTKEVRLQPVPLWREGNLSDSDPDLERLNDAFVRFAERVRPAVVHVRAVPSSTAALSNARGSGFIISAQGYILTANHVVAGAKEIEIRLADGQRFRGQLIGADPQVDFAIVKFNGDREFPTLSLGDSDTLEVGELVGSLGYPFGTESSLHVGIISRRGKRQNGSGAFDYIQTDTGANAGESGGPLVNMKGHVVGMVTMASEKGTIGFATPINVVKSMIPRILSAEKIAWGWLGVRLSELTLEFADTLGLSPVGGVLVSSVAAGQPADRAGILSRDVILSVNAMRVDRVNEVMRIIRGTEAGSEAKLTIFRRGETFELPVKLGDKPKVPDGVEG